MTAFDRLDPFEQRISTTLAEIAPTRLPEYLDDVFQVTARTRQRPRWTFPERWLPMDLALDRRGPRARVPFAALLLLGLLVLTLLATAAIYVGSQRRVPPPFGPAGNGQIVFGVEGDLYVRDTVSGTSRLLLGGEGEQGGVAHSPDGQLIAYDSVLSGVDRVWVAEANGSSPRQVLDRPFTGESFAWAPDSRSMAIVTHLLRPELWIAPADGSGGRLVELDGLDPWEATWDPQRPGVLLVRAESRVSRDVDLYYVDVSGSGTILAKLDMTGERLYGPKYEFAGLAFSPDGETIAYNSVESEAGGEHFWLHLMDRDGTNDRTLALPESAPALYSQAWAVFSPDGSWIAMESWATQPDGSAVNQIALAAADGSEPTRLIGPLVPGRTLVKTWWPDGSRLLVHVNDADDIYAIDPVSGTSELLPWKSDFPDFQRVALP